MRLTRSESVLLLTCLLWMGQNGYLNAQISQGGVPLSFSRAIPDLRDGSISLPPPDLVTAAEEDMRNPLPYRFAVNLPVDIGIEKNGIWTTLPSGESLWRIRIDAPGAKALILYFDHFALPEGGKLFLYNPARTQLLGAFTSENNRPLGTFATTYITGEAMIVEYDPPSGSILLPVLHINEIAWAYRGIPGSPDLTDDFGQSGDCEVNINCSEGSAWQKQKRGVARIHIKDSKGVSWCTGSLVNNVRHDGIPYFLTADHCGRYSTAQDLSQWVFAFLYESEGCPDPPVEPAYLTMTGAIFKARGGDSGKQGSDFYLVQLNDEIPENYNLYFNGWDRTTDPSPYGVGIHHPAGDIQKISTYTDSLNSSNWNGHIFMSHWKVVWSETQNGHGVTEGGSSGSPVFNPARRIVGTLTGGDSSCDTGGLDDPDYYGKFDWHWDKNGTDSASCLKYWLDPDGTDVMAIGGWAVGMEEQKIQTSVRLFPNPCMESFTLSLTDHGTCTMVLTDCKGSAVMRKTFDARGDETIILPVSSLPAGVYFLWISSDTQFHVEKVIKL